LGRLLEFLIFCPRLPGAFQIQLSTATVLPRVSAAGIGAHLTALDEAVHLGNLGRGAELYMTGDRADRVYILRDGRVKTWVHGPGGKHCLFQIIEPGEIFGEEGLMGRELRSASAEVLERAAITMLPTRAAIA